MSDPTQSLSLSLSLSLDTLTHSLTHSSLLYLDEEEEEVIETRNDDDNFERCKSNQGAFPANRVVVQGERAREGGISSSQEEDLYVAEGPKRDIDYSQFCI